MRKLLVAFDVYRHSSLAEPGFYLCIWLGQSLLLSTLDAHDYQIFPTRVAARAFGQRWCAHAGKALIAKAGGRA